VCGTGFATEGYSNTSTGSTASTRASTSFQRAIGKFGVDGPVEFCRGDAERLPFDDDSFDVVWSSGSIEYWPNPSSHCGSAGA